MNPESRGNGLKTWTGAQGLAEDVRYYGRWMRDEAQGRIGHLYPKVRLPREYGGGDATVISWIWARTVKCPNRACGANLPLVSSFVVSRKKGNEKWIQPLIRHGNEIEWSVAGPLGSAPSSPKVGQGAKFRCLVCQQTPPPDYIHDEIDDGRWYAQLLATVAVGPRSRIYIPPDDNQLDAAHLASILRIAAEKNRDLPSEPARGTFGGNAQGRRYGFRTFADYFTDRQLVALSIFSGLVREVRVQVTKDGADSAYTDAVATYLAFAVSRGVDYWSSTTTWASSGEFLRNTFARQAIEMAWDFAEGNPFSDSTGNWLN